MYNADVESSLRGITKPLDQHLPHQQAAVPRVGGHGLPLPAEQGHTRLNGSAKLGRGTAQERFSSEAYPFSPFLYDRPSSVDTRNFVKDFKK